MSIWKTKNRIAVWAIAAVSAFLEKRGF